ncbi:hypothetical protein DY000_02017913, partial [Brassica cretica]
SVDSAISCGIVTISLAPCANYLSKGGVFPAPCCDGVIKLNGVVQTTPAGPSTSMQMPTVRKDHCWSQPKFRLQPSWTEPCHLKKNLSIGLGHHVLFGI